MKLRYFQILFSETPEPFVDFNTDAIHVFLLLLHHEYGQLPSEMSVDQLYALAELCAELDSDDTQDTSESLGEVLSAQDILSSSEHVRTWISVGWNHERPIDPDWIRWDWILLHLTDQSEPCAKTITVSHILAANMYDHLGVWVFGTEKEPVHTARTDCKFTWAVSVA
jgi:hypothetical protein